MAQVRTNDKAALFAEIKTIVKSKGGKVLSNEYVSARDPLDMQCAEGHLFPITQSNLKNDRWCPDCGKVKRAKNRIDLKGDGYLKEICKGRSIICLDKVYKGVKALHRFQCLICEHIWSSTPDNISQGKGCPPCAKGVGRILEPNQKGRLISISEGFFRNGSAELKTHEYTEVQFTGPVRKYYESLDYSAPINTLMWIRTKHLPATSNYALTFQFVLCGVVSKRPLSNAIKSRGCASCFGNQIGDALRFDPRDLEKEFGITITEYKNSDDRMKFNKKCGCPMSQSLGVLRLTGVGYCRHDSEFTWRTFENYIRDELDGVKPSKRVHGVTVDILTESYVIETKLDIRACSSNYGRRSPLEAIDGYRLWAADNQREFYVVVNEPDEVLRTAGLPLYYLGWESWNKVGLSDEAVAFGKKIAANPEEHRIRKATKEDEAVAKRFKALAKKLDRMPKGKELKENDIPLVRLAMVALGTNGGSLRDIAKALEVDVQPFSIAKEDRPKFIAKYLKESKKAGYLLTNESKELVGVSVNQIMAWVLGKSAGYSMAALQKILGTNIPVRRAFK